jgi:hypothetical protein
MLFSCAFLPTNLQGRNLKDATDPDKPRQPHSKLG